MVNSGSRVRSFLAKVAACLCAGVPVASIAETQDVPARSSEAIVEEVVVTGSRIKRRDFSSLSPLTTLDLANIEYSGRPTLEELLNTMPQVFADFGRTSNNPGEGKARVNLRGLGAGRTLVLVNGRRLAPSGVVNFILREDFQGLNVEGSYGITGEGDADTRDINVAFGTDFLDGRGNVTAYAGFLEREVLYASEREFTSVPLQDDYQGNVVQQANYRTPRSPHNDWAMLMAATAAVSVLSIRGPSVTG